jgi:hypothetical protein
MTTPRSPSGVFRLIVGVALCVPSVAFAAGPETPTKQQPRSPAPRAGVPPAVVTVTESIAVGDTPAALPPAVINIRESLGVTDKPGGAPPPPAPPPSEARPQPAR